jgi:hypothetical protein
MNISAWHMDGAEMRDHRCAGIFDGFACMSNASSYRPCQFWRIIDGRQRSNIAFDGMGDERSSGCVAVSIRIERSHKFTRKKQVNSASFSVMCFFHGQLSELIEFQILFQGRLAHRSK